LGSVRGRVERADLFFESQGELCPAWLYVPSEGVAPHPCVVLAHGLTAVREARLDAYAEHFAAAGIASLVFDYRHFGASGGELRHLGGWFDRAVADQTAFLTASLGVPVAAGSAPARADRSSLPERGAGSARQAVG
jgi:fermentation-respiration switch protein FrsA (DUF1100 family)